MQRRCAACVAIPMRSASSTTGTSRLVASLARISGDRELAFELAQEAFARALEHGHRVRLPPEGSAWPWLWSVGRNLLSDWQRRGIVDASARARLGIASVPDDADAIDDLIARLDAAVLAEPLERALAALPAAEREVVAARVTHDLTYEEVAAAHETSEQVIRAGVARAARYAYPPVRGEAMSDSVFAFRSELHEAAVRRIAARRRRLRLGLIAASLVVAAVAAGITVAATHWPVGEPAPPAVLEDFQSYTPQLGFFADPKVRTVRFEGFFGEHVERAVGEQGFFVAGVDARICPEESWTPTFVALDGDGDEVARAAITLIHVQRVATMPSAPVCGFAVGPHGPYDD
jgi:RNA polymerase sigma-70 factor, ECF subfamily